MEYKRGAEAPLSRQNAAALELHTERELQLARMRRTIWEWSVADRAILIDVAAGCTVVDMVEDIERIHTELDRRNLVDGEVLLDRQVRIEKVRTKDAVPAYVTDLVQPG